MERSHVTLSEEYLKTHLGTYSTNSPSELDCIPSSTHTLIIRWIETYDPSITLAHLEIRKLVIAPYCCDQVTQFVLDGMPVLETVWFLCDSVHCKECKEKENQNECHIVNCPLLRQVIIGYKCFFHCRVCEWRNLPSLQYLEFGDESFFSAKRFELKGD